MSSGIANLITVFLLLIALIFLSVLGLFATALDYGRQTINFLDVPFVKLFEKIGAFFEFIGRLKELSSQNEILRAKVEKLTAEVAGLQKDKRENKFLREALGFVSQSGLDLVPAEVIGWDALTISQAVTLNRGGKQGVEVGRPVVSESGILIGVISEALENTSQMELLSSSEVVVNVEVLPSTATGVIRGEHGLGILLDLVSQSEVINPGDKVVTSGLGGQFPKSLLIGEIGKIVSGSSDLFQKASILGAANARNSRVVFVVKK